MPLSVPTRRERRGPLALAMLALFGLVIPAGVLAARPVPPAPVNIQILNVSDWHGNVDPVTDVGGAWNISDRWKEDRTARPTLTLTAGDDIGASPPLVSFFDEVPSILAQRLMGIQVGTFGNHNFDAGTAHLQQMVDLAAAPTSAEAPGDPFKYVVANVMNLKANVTGVEPFALFDVGGANVAVIGIINEEAPSLVLPGAFGTVIITDGVEAANKYAAIARGKHRADAVIVITHKGVRDADPATGELVDFANALDPTLIDVVIGDHTDIQYSGTHNGILVHENRSFGQSYAKTLLTVQPTGRGVRGHVTAKSMSFVTPSGAGALSDGNTSCGALTYCDEAIVDMLIPYREELAELLDEKIGTTTEPFKRGANIERSGQTPIGDLVADSMRARYGTDLALVNSGGIRQQLPTCSYLPQDTSLNRGNWNTSGLPPFFTTVTTCPGYQSGTPMDIVLGDARGALNFANILNTRTVTGAQLWLALEHGVRFIDSSGNGANGAFPQISGFKFSFRYDLDSGCTGPTTCNIVRIQSVALTDGTPILNDTSQTFTLTLPNFVNLGGDGYFMFNDGTGASQEIDWIVLSEYIRDNPALDPNDFPNDRIIECNGPCA